MFRYAAATNATKVTLLIDCNFARKLRIACHHGFAPRPLGNATTPRLGVAAATTLRNRNGAALAGGGCGN